MISGSVSVRQEALLLDLGLFGPAQKTGSGAFHTGQASNHGVVVVAVGLDVIVGQRASIGARLLGKELGLEGPVAGAAMVAKGRLLFVPLLWCGVGCWGQAGVDDESMGPDVTRDLGAGNGRRAPMRRATVPEEQGSRRTWGRESV